MNLHVIAKWLDLTTAQVKTQGCQRLTNAHMYESTEQDHRALSMIDEIHCYFNGDSEIKGFSKTEIESILFDICVN